MEKPYYLWSGKMQGWLTRAGNYSSDPAEALEVTRSDALVYCRRHKGQAGYQLLPVAVEDLEAI